MTSNRLAARNLAICDAFQAGTPRAVLAQQFGITRGQVNRILGPVRTKGTNRGAAAVRMYRAGASLAQVATRFGVWRSTVSRWVNAAA